MAISTKLSVAVHILALLEMSSAASETSEHIAASVNTNPVVIRRIMSQLKKAGLIASKPGTKTNRVIKPTTEITLDEVYHAVEGDRDVFNIHKNPHPDCIVGGNIQHVLEEEFAKVQKQMEASLATITLAQVVTELEQEAEKKEHLE